MKKYTLAFSLQKCPLTTEDISRLLSHYCCHKKRPLNSILCVEAYSYCAKVLHCKIWPFHYSSSLCVYSLKEISDIHQKKKKKVYLLLYPTFLEETSIPMALAFSVWFCFANPFFDTVFETLQQMCYQKNHSNSIITIAFQVPVLCHYRLLLSLSLVIQDIWNWMYICYYSETYHLTLK